MKRIAITQRIIETTEYVETRDALDVNWMKVFKALDFLPIILPSNFDSIKIIAELKPAGIILSGGNDLSSFSNSNVNTERDAHEIKLLKYAMQNSIPVMGICRGMQLMSQELGGKLKKTEGHVGKMHSISANKNSKYSSTLQSLNQVNSYHNYVIEKLPNEFLPSATSEEGYFEAMEHQTLPILGIMWHPERNSELKKEDLELFKQIFGDK